MSSEPSSDGSDILERLETAIEVLSGVCDGPEDRRDHGTIISRRLRESDIPNAVSIYQPEVEMDVLRYGMPAEDAIETIREETESELGSEDDDVVADIVSVITEYATEVEG